MQTDVIIAGVSALGLTVALVALLRQRLHWCGLRLVVAALVCGQVLAIGSWGSVRYPGFTELWQAIITGLVLSLSAMGFWSGSKTAREALSGQDCSIDPPGGATPVPHG